jgi:hypothetical protein
MIFVETVPGIGGGGVVGESSGRGEFKYAIFDIL